MDKLKHEQIINELLGVKEEKEKYENIIDDFLNTQIKNAMKMRDSSEFMYSVGLYNGLALAKALYLGVEPEFFDGTKIRRMNDENGNICSGKR